MTSARTARSFVILCVLFFLKSLSYSQGEFDVWYFGIKAGISFKTGVPAALQTNPMSQGAYIAGASVSDSSGKLLFFSNGQKVWNRNNNWMPNGTGLLGGVISCQAVLAVKDITDPDKYYLFTVGYRELLPFNPIVGLHYSVINMQLDGGLGDIEPGFKNIPLPMGDSAIVQLTATRHQNNRDAWVVVLRHGTTEQYLAYLIDSSGLNTTPVISTSTLKNKIRSGILPNDTDDMSGIRISPNGKYLVCTDSLTEICLFNTGTGKVTPQFAGLYGSIYGKEFSIDSRYLYIRGSLPGDTISAPLYQYDMSDLDSLVFLQSQILIGDSSNGIIQMAPDGKIYVTTNPYSDMLHVINNPSIHGTGCNYEKNAFSLQGNNHYFCLPQFLQRYKAYIHHDSVHCAYDPIHFSADIWPPPDSIHWDFGDPGSGGANSSNDTTPSHVYSTPGNYTVTLFVRHIDLRTDTSWKTITVLPSPQPVLGPDRSICLGDSVTFDAGACAGCTYKWRNLTLGQIVGTGQTYTANQTGIYQVAVTNSDSCVGLDTVQLIVSPRPQVTNNPLFKSICSGEATNISLSSSEPGTLFRWTASLTSGTVTGFSADSGLMINQVLVNTTATAGIVTYHIVPNVGNCFGDTANFQVTVNPGDSAKVSISASANNICAGIPVTFTATPVNGGTNPGYQWKVNGNPAGTNDSVFSYVPSDNDKVWCILTSSVTVCISNNPANSDTITMIVHANLPVSDSISPSANPVCAGAPVTLTAFPSGEGTNPSYQWKLNGVNAGTNSTTFTFTPVNGDFVTCTLTSSETCTTGNPATSNRVTMTVTPLSLVTISISASTNPVCSGIPVTFTAFPGNPGTSPVYQWTVNGLPAGSNSTVYTYTPLNGDHVICTLTSNINCPSGNPATSNMITMTISPAPVVTFPACFDTLTTISAKPIKLKGGVPYGGTYSGPGVSAGVFTPSIAGTGTKTITYSYTNAALCSASKTRRIIVQPNPAFACGNNLTDIRDNKVYPTVLIGTQCWMASNLDYGTQIPDNTHQRDNCVNEKYASFVPRPSSFYQWDELMLYNDTPGLQGLCPPGWHVPSEADWNTLFAVWTNNAFAGAPLKYSGYSGFNAAMLGASHMNRQWDFRNFAAFFWSSTPWGPNKAWAHGINDPDFSVSVYPSLRSNAFSVRCVKD